METTRRLFLSAAAAAAGRPVRANDKIEIGMIGTGARAHELMQAIQKLPAAEIVAVTDAYTGRVERAIDRTGGRAQGVRNYKELLQRPGLDAVVVATPDHWHRQMVLDALAAGKHVYCEKPLTFRVEEGAELVQAARRASKRLIVGSQGVSSDVQQKAKAMIQAGKLGRVTMIRASYNRNTASGAWIYPIPPDASPRTVDWEAFLGPAKRRPFSLERFFRWRCYWDYSGGIATDLFVHLCTTIHYLMEAAAPTAVIALGQLYRWKESREVPDTLNAVLEYPGFTVNLSSTFNSQASPGQGFFIMGTEGSLELGWGTLTYAPENGREDNRWIIDSWPKRLAEQYYQDPRVIDSEVTPRPRKEPERITGESIDPTVRHFEAFFKGIQDGTPYWEDAVAGHQAAACAHWVNQSAREGRLVRPAPQSNPGSSA